jgi:hypothetical protein
MKKLLKSLFELTSDIRYVALYVNEALSASVRSDLQNASSSDSDRYEELLVNPTLLTLVRQRGNIDCGGLDYVLVRYGNFYQLVMPLQNGHLSICIEPSANPLQWVQPIRTLIEQTKTSERG